VLVAVLAIGDINCGPWQLQIKLAQIRVHNNWSTRH